LNTPRTADGLCCCLPGSDMSGMGVDHGGTNPPPQKKIGAGDCPPFLSCCKILSTRLLVFNVEKCVFCLYSRTFIVSPPCVPPQNFSQIYAYAVTEFRISTGSFRGSLKTWLNKITTEVKSRSTSRTTMLMLILLHLFVYSFIKHGMSERRPQTT